MTSVLVVGGARPHREALAEVLRARPTIRSVEVVIGIEAALERLRETRPDVVIVDVEGGEDGEGIRMLVAAAPQVRVVVFGVTESEHEVVVFAEAGVSGYVPRQASLDYLVEEIDSVARGQLLASPELAAILLRRVRALAGGRPNVEGELSARQLEILALIEEGLSNKQIARRLSIELQTVKNHVHNILDRLGLHSRTEAAAWVRRHGLAANGGVSTRAS
jgi:two-component system, NarL family, nitrate/nitrite response regulator NarL